MAKKKNTPISVSQEENAQAQQMLEQYQQIATTLRASTDQQEVETALAEINSLPEGTQIALAKELAKINHSDAADVLLALNEFAELKTVRKEAKRSLIRLEGTRIYPRWEPPVESPSPISTALTTSTNPPRFWKGFVTDSRDLGEVSLILAWQQGEDYKEVLVLSFLLEFWQDGVKDFFTRVESKRSFENFVEHTLKLALDLRFKDCSLEEGRGMLRTALDVNKRWNNKPHKDYQAHFSLIDELMSPMSATPDTEELEEEEEEGEPVDLGDLEPMDLVTAFIQFSVDGDYEIAYELLAPDSPLREGLSKSEWVERRDVWAEKYGPDNLKPSLLYQREPQKPKFWLPFSKGPTKNQQEVVVGWSVEIETEHTDDPLPEWPLPTAVYEEIKRHWFWASYTLVQENNEWLIESMTDEGVKAQSLSVDALSRKIESLDKALEDFAKTYRPEEMGQLDAADMRLFMTTMANQMAETASYTDILLKKLPLDRTIYEEATTRMFRFGQFERCLVYLLPLTQRFPDKHGTFLRRTAQIYRRLSERYLDEDEDERSERALELAEKFLRDSLAVEDHVDAHFSLAELFIGKNEQLDEAEEHLTQVRKLSSSSQDEAHAELHLGEIATLREEYKQALTHYQRVVEILPNSPSDWFNVGDAHERLGNFEEAVTSFRRAIELDPEEEEYYTALGLMYKDNNQDSQAVEVIESGLQAIPDSVELHVAKAVLYMDDEDYDQADVWLEKAEKLDPTAETVRTTRQTLIMTKSLRASAAQRTPKLSEPKKKGKRHH
jgi:tetratricopeptide (TPR) repeat protein